MSEERWADVPGYEGRYEVSSLGRVRGRGGRVLYQQTTRKAYRRVALRLDKTKRDFTVHRLVLRAFVGECPDGLEAAHLNGVRTDNRIDNLRWLTRIENHSHKLLHGTHQAGELHGCHKLTAAQVLVIRSSPAPGTVLAEAFGVSPSAISGIRIGRTWSDGAAIAASRTARARREQAEVDEEEMP